MCVISSGTVCLALYHDLFKSGVVHEGVDDVLKLRIIIYVSWISLKKNQRTLFKHTNFAQSTAKDLLRCAQIC